MQMSNQAVMRLSMESTYCSKQEKAQWTLRLGVNINTSNVQEIRQQSKVGFLTDRRH